MSIEDFALRFEGFNDQQIAQLKAALPDIEHLVGVLQANFPAINRIQAGVAQLLPDLVKLEGVINSEMPRINKVIPVIKMAVAVINATQKEFHR